MQLTWFLQKLVKKSMQCTQQSTVCDLPYSDSDEVIDELFEWLRSIYQRNLEISMRGSDFIFDSVQIVYYKCHKVYLYMVLIILILQIRKEDKSSNKS